MHLNQDGSVTLTREEAVMAWECVSACVELDILTEGKAQEDGTALMGNFSKILR